MRDYRKLEVWKKAHELTLLVYREVLPILPKTEIFHLGAQMKRAAYSIPLNIVEGSGKSTEADFVRFLDISLGSAHELEYCIFLSKDLLYISEDLYNGINEFVNQVKAMLIGLIKSIRKQSEAESLKQKANSVKQTKKAFSLPLSAFSLTNSKKKKNETI